MPWGGCPPGGTPLPIRWAKATRPSKACTPLHLAARPGWEAMPAVRHGELHEVKSPIILQPGPAALFDGLAEIQRIILAWSARQPPW